MESDTIKVHEGAVSGSVNAADEEDRAVNWTKEQLEKIPPVYSDFMLAIKPVIDSKRPGVLLRISGIPLGRIFNSLNSRYDYSPHQVRAIADNLKAGGLVEEDRLGFFTPTAKGEALILAIAGREEPVTAAVPQLPEL